MAQAAIIHMPAGRIFMVSYLEQPLRVQVRDFLAIKVID